MAEATGQGAEPKARGKNREKKPGRTFIGKKEMAEEIGISPRTIDEYIARGTYPPPHSRWSEKVCVWRRDHWKAFVEKGVWPKEAFELGTSRAVR